MKLSQHHIWYLAGGILIGVAIMLPFTIEFREPTHTIDTANIETADVLKVVDGDTIEITLNGKVERVRFQGINTPETVDTRVAVECYGPEASKHMKELLTGKTVQLQKTPGEDRDKYDRLLRYVSLDGRDIAAEMLKGGYAISYCYAFQHPRCHAYDLLEAEAKAEKVGLWGHCILGANHKTMFPQ
jgi:micrococcal nuclease